MSASRDRFHAFSIALIALILACASVARAGSLLLKNSGTAVVICQPSSGPAVSVPAGGSATVHPPPKSEIRSLRCGRLSFRALNLSSDSSDRELFLNGRQTRTLSAALFPYLPTPSGDFTPLIKLIVNQYQRLYPDVALDLVIDLNKVKPYDFTKLPTYLGSSSDAYDALEIDTSVLRFLTDGNYITTIPAPPDPPLQVAQRAVQTGTQGLFWGVPTWICRDFFFSYDSTITGITNSDRLVAYLKILPVAPPRVAAIFNGQWTLLSLYVNGYVSLYGYSTMNDALTKPIDSTVIATLASIARYCTASNGGVPCIDQTYQNLPDGQMESMFASGGMATDVGYSERSFFMQTARSQPPYVVQMPYGPSPVPVVFVDALVRNKAICSNDPCATDVKNFANYLSGTNTRAMIALSQDIAPGPWRRLLPATAAFYSLPPVQNDPVYASIIPLIKTMQPAPINITAAVLNERAVSVCGALKAQPGLSSYVCPTPAPQHS